MTSQDQVKVLYAAAQGRNTKCKLDSKRTAWVKMATGFTLGHSQEAWEDLYLFVCGRPPENTKCPRMSLIICLTGLVQPVLFLFIFFYILIGGKIS